jgi:hypothetical protein
LTKVRDTSENGMAVVAAVKAGELLQQGALADEIASKQRGPGLQIVIVQPSGERMIAYQPPSVIPTLDVTPVPEAEPARHVGDDFEADVG